MDEEVKSQGRIWVEFDREQEAIKDLKKTVGILIERLKSVVDPSPVDDTGKDESPEPVSGALIEQIIINTVQISSATLELTSIIERLEL